MSMPISSIGSGAVTLMPKLPGMQAKSAEQRAVVNQVIASLPGNSRPVESKQQNLGRIASDMTRIGQTFNKKLQFVVDHQSNEVIVKVIDKATDKVIKVIPPEELQRLHRKLKETIGFLFNEEV